MQHTFSSNQQKENFAHAAHFFVFPSLLFCTTTTPYCMTKMSNFLVTHFYEGIVVCLPDNLFPVFIFTFIFHRRSFSPCWLLLAGRQHFSFSHRRFEFPCSSPLFSITRSSSFSVIRVSVNIKHNAKKETTLFCCFSKSPGSHVISFQIKP